MPDAWILLVIFGALCVASVMVHLWMQPPITYNLLNVEWLDRTEAIMTFERQGARRGPFVVQYRGESTVWRNVLTGERPGTMMEVMLAEFYTKAKWKREAEERGR